MKFLALLLLPLTSFAAAGTATSGGRFQLVQLSDMRRDQYMIDTQTGKLWIPSCTKIASDGVGCAGTMLFVSVPVEGVSISGKEILKQYQSDNSK